MYQISALGDRAITVEVRLIATKGEYASWRATRATGDFDLPHRRWPSRWRRLP